MFKQWCRSNTTLRPPTKPAGPEAQKQVKPNHLHDLDLYKSQLSREQAEPQCIPTKRNLFNRPNMLQFQHVSICVCIYVLKRNGVCVCCVCVCVCGGGGGRGGGDLLHDIKASN